MALQDITGPSSVIATLNEFSRMGREAFLTKYGFGPARSYFIRYEDQLFDSKAIAGAAHGYQFPKLGPLEAADFSGGESTVKRKLEDLGFEVETFVPSQMRYTASSIHTASTNAALAPNGSTRMTMAGITDFESQPFVVEYSDIYGSHYRTTYQSGSNVYEMIKTRSLT